MPSEEQIVHVSDTALMVAACRAIETVRPDGLVCDPLAERLAGARGKAIAQNVPGLPFLTFGIAIRSYFLDELVLDLVATQRVDTVLCLGCGLDTRPWRLRLPPELRWIEVDFPAMLEYKTGVLANEQPQCRLERIAADLNEASARQAVLAAAGDSRALLVTEGLLMYLPSETVEALAVEVAATSAISHWLLDLSSKEMSRRVAVDSIKSIENVRAPTHLDGVEIVATLQRNGWVSRRHRSYTSDAWQVASGRIQSMLGADPAPREEKPLPADDPSGVHVFTRG